MAAKRTRETQIPQSDEGDLGLRRKMRLSSPQRPLWIALRAENAAFVAKPWQPQPPQRPHSVQALPHSSAENSCDAVPDGETEDPVRRRLLRHMKMYHANNDKAALLTRYKTKAAAMCPRELVRHISHVAAWVALLPPADAVRKIGSDGISPVSVLRSLLRCRGKAPFSPRLRSALGLVMARLKHVGHNDEQWEALRRAMPRIRWKTNAASDPETHLAQRTDADPQQDARNAADPPKLPSKLLMAMNTAIMKWKNQTTAEDRESYLEDLQSRLNKAPPGDAPTLGIILQDLVAGLSPPRFHNVANVASHEGGDVVPHEAHHNFAFQHNLRKLTLRCLKKLDGRTARAMVAVEHIRGLIDKYEASSGSEISKARAGKEWLKIKSILTGADLETYDVDQITNRPPVKKKVLHPAKARSYSHKGGVIKHMMMEAMRRLEGSATYREIVRFCRNDASIQQEFGEHLLRDILDGRPKWEKSIASSMAIVFRASGKKRGERFVYTWR